VAFGRSLGRGQILPYWSVNYPVNSSVQPFKFRECDL
jgi:hypothetical protein